MKLVAKIILLALISILALFSSSCFYYKDMPEEWAGQIVEIDNCTIFDGDYAVFFIPKYLKKIFRLNQLDKEIGELDYVDSLNIQVNSNEVIIKFYIDEKLIGLSRFDKGSFECRNDTLRLNLKGELGIEYIFIGSTARNLILHKSKSDEVYCEKKETLIGLTCFLPTIGGDSEWFKITKIQP